MDWFVRACLTEENFELQPADAWTDDLWFLDQDHRILEPNDGWWSIGAGRGTGRLVGGNLCTLNLLQGTAYWPSLNGAVLAVEDDELTNPVTFARDLTSLLQQPDAAAIRGLLVGRFQRASGLSRGVLEQILARQPHLAGLPVLGNVDFGHTSPLATLPIGGRVELDVGGSGAGLRILEH
jgi:muramoyltetrapeptide carboxypeptidase LdcA involved in peptidoglycan recycling